MVLDHMFKNFCATLMKNGNPFTLQFDETVIAQNQNTVGFTETMDQVG